MDWTLDELAELAFVAYWEGGYETTWEHLLESHKEQWRRVVRAVLRESTKGQVHGQAE